ncbi:RteC domain-containing protein [Pedobacter jamesrossensis]|uniref:RteC domain-containing protein n=1 Tax=Pedobacter jamesrossensis TaxID=1908238 RepID=A0ABV8NKU5_9SPHI
MLSKPIEKLLIQLTDGLAHTAGQKLTPSGRLAAALQLIRRLLLLLREQVMSEPFKSKQEEIHFFKMVKPIFLAAKIFELERYNLEQSKPAGSWGKLLSYYERELEIIQRFFLHYAYLYQYFRAGAVEMDELYFLRGAEVPSVLVSEFEEHDIGFSTCGDHLFARFKAYEDLQDHIIEQIHLGSSADKGTQHSAYVSKKLTWTGESINLVELGYGLYDSGQLNHGKAGINDIFTWLAEHLNVSIGIPARRFVEIKRRKRLSRTRFLDNMRDSINKKIDDDERYEPEKLKSKRERQS